MKTDIGFSVAGSTTDVEGRDALVAIDGAICGPDMTTRIGDCISLGKVMRVRHIVGGIRSERWRKTTLARGLRWDLDGLPHHPRFAVPVPGPDRRGEVLRFASYLRERSLRAVTGCRSLVPKHRQVSTMRLAEKYRPKARSPTSQVSMMRVRFFLRRCIRAYWS